MTIEHLAENFWNIRGVFKIVHTLNIGTQMSLVRRPSGAFVMLDSYQLDDADRSDLMTLTNQGAQIEAILNVHPFHTVDCEFLSELLPDARLIGTRRHHQELSHLKWDPNLIEEQATQQQFADCLDFSIPDGVEFVCDDESIHVSSVLVRHGESGIVHVDDTLMYLDLPTLLEKFGAGPKLRFHPKLADALQKRPGAANDFIAWARRLALEWQDTQTICAAHKGILHLQDSTFGQAIETALDHSSSVLENHRETHG